MLQQNTLDHPNEVVTFFPKSDFVGVHAWLKHSLFLLREILLIKSQQ
jgi:hypothetical protein